jgi:uncharacterized RDD family membrane protein YckC
MIKLEPLFARTARYEDPEGRYLAVFATPWRRTAAATIDWALCCVLYLLVSIPLGAVQGVALLSWEDRDLGGLPGHVVIVATQFLTLAPVIAYFGVLLPTSHTLGMRAMGLSIVSTNRGRAPSYAVAILRGLVATAIAAGVYLTVLVATSYTKPRHLDTASKYALTSAHVAFAVGCVSALALILTATHRSLVDRVFGTGVLDNLEAVTPQMGPWGPLDAFDLSRESAPAVTSAAPRT